MNFVKKKNLFYFTQKRKGVYHLFFAFCFIIIYSSLFFRFPSARELGLGVFFLLKKETLNQNGRESSVFYCFVAPFFNKKKRVFHRFLPSQRRHKNHETKKTKRRPNGSVVGCGTLIGWRRRKKQKNDAFFCAAIVLIAAPRHFSRCAFVIGAITLITGRNVTSRLFPNVASCRLVRLFVCLFVCLFVRLLRLRRSVRRPGRSFNAAPHLHTTVVGWVGGWVGGWMGGGVAGCFTRRRLRPRMWNWRTSFSSQLTRN